MKKRHYAGFTRQYYISLTEFCNWHCQYCDFPKLQEHKTAPIERVLEVFDMLKQSTNNDAGVEYGLEGGEIGILAEDYLDQVFAHDLAESYVICTNGLFMERGYHKRYQNKVHYILYHARPELDNFFINQYDYDGIMVHYAIVVTKENLDNGLFEEVINKHNGPGISFLPHIIQPRTPGLELLSLEDYQHLYNIIKDKSNVNQYFIPRVARIIDNIVNEEWMEERRIICSNSYMQPIIDLPNDRINRCCVSITGEAVPITNKNLIDLYQNKKMFPSLKDHICNGCIANFVWADERLAHVATQAQEVIQQFRNKGK